MVKSLEIVISIIKSEITFDRGASTKRKKQIGFGITTLI
jgi:hypothetical protein